MAAESSKSHTGLIATIGGGCLLGIMMFWLQGMQDTVTDVIGLKPQIESLQTRMVKVEQWQEDWPTQGELSGDIRQNKDIEALQRAVERLESYLDQIKEELHALQIARAREGRQ